jgi:hypothetical protein
MLSLEEALDPTQTRTLMLIGTALQKMANLQLFSEQETHWHELNPFLEQHFQPFKHFIDELVQLKNTVNTSINYSLLCKSKLCFCIDLLLMNRIS